MFFVVVIIVVIIAVFLKKTKQTNKQVIVLQFMVHTHQGELQNSVNAQLQSDGCPPGGVRETVRYPGVSSGALIQDLFSLLDHLG